MLTPPARLPYSTGSPPSAARRTRESPRASSASASTTRATSSRAGRRTCRTPTLCSRSSASRRRHPPRCSSRATRPSWSTARWYSFGPPAPTRSRPRPLAHTAPPPWRLQTTYNNVNGGVVVLFESQLDSQVENARRVERAMQAWGAHALQSFPTITLDLSLWLTCHHRLAGRPLHSVRRCPLHTFALTNAQLAHTHTQTCSHVRDVKQRSANTVPRTHTQTLRRTSNSSPCHLRAQMDTINAMRMQVGRSLDSTPPPAPTAAERNESFPVGRSTTVREIVSSLKPHTSCTSNSTFTPMTLCVADYFTDKERNMDFWSVDEVRAQNSLFIQTPLTAQHA